MNLHKSKIFEICKVKFPAVFCVAVFLVFPNFTAAKTFDEYKKNINELKKDFVSLLMPPENLSDVEINENRQEVFAKAIKLLPAEEKIEFDETTFEVSNKWIAEKIEEYKLNEKNSEDKLIILTSIYERLEAIEFKLAELENSLAPANGKDEVKRKLSEILQREEFRKPKVEESFLQRIWRWFDEWMKRSFPPRKAKPLPASNFASVAYFLQILLYTFIIGLIGFLIYKFAPFIIKNFREREKRKGEKERFILGEKLSANETSENLFSEAEKLAREGNLREAIRKGYIALLFELSERKLVGLAKHKTNRDYLRSVRNKRELYKRLNGLTNNYERHWYGFKDTSETDWEEFKIDYKKALNKN